LVCLTSRTSGGPITCGEPASVHCSSCLACGTPCACPPLPAVGTQVMPTTPARWNSTTIPSEPHTVVATWDHRRTGEPDDHVIVVQPTALVQHAVRHREPVNTEYGHYLGLDDITVLDLPRITFTAKETTP